MKPEEVLRELNDAIAHCGRSQLVWLAIELEARRRAIGARLAPQVVPFVDRQSRRAR